jgi:hypothetical protein
MIVVDLGNGIRDSQVLGDLDATLATELQQAHRFVFALWRKHSLWLAHGIPLVSLGDGEAFPTRP